ncbi:hypothetical protein GCM10023190_07980 [Enteractinococcus fodinae]|uniref:Glycerophosphoryl diester phosphodiesterase membrane domain-containing protein n=1 Tax=Enteractinococcus fodinae TaxID=684663 RepID=A0ABU2AZE7_9MICC|nr:glycerophosphoryl diester phosphodiesterase membrane domain-containing protein [Enteractinococcus fodinae]MDR7346724.1 hypothetical protein [Enteractinococcus fodinae]
MSQYGPPNPPPEHQGPQQPGSYSWSSQDAQPSPYPNYGGQAPYVAASQPGTLPLRPLTLGDYFASMFTTIRKSPGLFFGAALIFGSIAAILAATGEFFLLRSFGTAMFDPSAAFDQIFSGLGLGFFGAMMLSQLVMLLGQTLNWGMYSAMVARGAIGMKTSLGQGFRLLRGQWGRLIGLIALLIAAVVVVWLVVALLVFLVIAVAFAGGEPQSGAGVAATVISVLVAVFAPLVVALFLVIRWYLVIPTMIIEDVSIFAALRRSWRLTRGHFWRTLGIVLLFALILGIVSAIITSPLSFISGFIVASAGTEAELFGSVMVVNLLINAIATLITFIVTNMAVLISIFFYFDYRFRKEGLSLHFQQLASQYAAGARSDRFDTSMQQPVGADDEADDTIPGRHATPATSGAPFGPGLHNTGQHSPLNQPHYPYPTQQPPHPGQSGPQGPPAPPTPPGSEQ